MKLDTNSQLKIFFQAYQELNQIIDNQDIKELTQDLIKKRAIERLLGIIAISVKRLQKLNPNWQIPQYSYILKLKNRIIWNIEQVRYQWLRHVIQNVLPAIYKYLKQKQNEIQTLSNNSDNNS